MELRKVQRVGYSTLTVSLPTGWAKEVGLKAGSIVTLKREDDGSLRVLPGVGEKTEQPVRYIINADLCDKDELLTRVIAGNYVVGHDTIEISSKAELKPRHLEEIRSTTQRLTGLGIVEQTLKRVVLQSFVDPTKFPIQGLLRRMHIIIMAMQEAAVKALIEGRPDLAGQVQYMEDEVDRIYWLVVRQLLLALGDRTVSAKLGVASPLHIAGNRVIAKTLEEMADCATNVAEEVLQLRQEQYINHKSVLQALSEFNKQVQAISENIMKAFFALDIALANDALQQINGLKKQERNLIEKIQTQVRSIPLAVALRTVVWNLSQMAKYSKIVGEIAINQALEQPSGIVSFEKA